jgi:hypothetical protein
MMRRTDRLAYTRRTALPQQSAKTPRTSQIVFGERQYLLRVLDSIERTLIPAGQRRREQALLERLIYSRTLELERLSPNWDSQVHSVLRPGVTPEELDKLAKNAPEEDYFLLRLISEHPRASSETLAALSHHPYGAIRENVARHPNADAKTLTELSRDTRQPLWFLVATNPSAPAPLRRRLEQRIKKMSKEQRPK